MDFRIRVAEGQDPQSTLLWDTVWSGTGGDWAIAGAQAGNQGGLAARAAIATAILLCLFTDRRCPDDHPLRFLADNDPRGWWGDGVDVRDDLGEGAMGSLLWLLERSILTAPETKMWAEAFALEALRPLIDQGVAVKATAVATANPALGRLDMEIALFGRDGQAVFSQRFQDLWRQVAAGPSSAGALQTVGTVGTPPPVVPTTIPQLDFSDPNNSGYVPLVGF